MHLTKLISSVLIACPLFIGYYNSAHANNHAGSATNSLQQKKEAIQKKYNQKYANEFTVHNGCDSGKHLMTSYLAEGDDNIRISTEGDLRGNLQPIRTSYFWRMLLGDYNIKTKKVSNTFLIVSAENCAMFNNYEKNKATDQYGNKYDVISENKSDSSAVGYSGKDVPSYREDLRIPIDVNLLRKYQNKGITIRLHTSGNGNDSQPRKYYQDVLIEPALIKKLLTADDGYMSDLDSYL